MEAPDRAEWTAVTLAKQASPSSPFQKMDLCQDCTTGLRQFLQFTHKFTLEES